MSIESLSTEGDYSFEELYLRGRERDNIIDFWEKVYVQPVMSKPADRSEAGVVAGYNEQRGAYVEGRWTWTWEGKESASLENKNSKEQCLDPPDSRDRDFDCGQNQ